MYLIEAKLVSISYIGSRHSSVVGYVYKIVAQTFVETVITQHNENKCLRLSFYHFKLCKLHLIVRNIKF